MKKRNIVYYSTVFLINQNIKLTTFNKIVTSLENIIKENKKSSIKKDFLGIKPLFYEIKQQKKAYYLQFDFKLVGTDEERRKVLTKIEDFYKLENNILKFATMIVDKENI